MKLYTVISTKPGNDKAIYSWSSFVYNLIFDKKRSDENEIIRNYITTLSIK